MWQWRSHARFIVMLLGFVAGCYRLLAALLDCRTRNFNLGWSAFKFLHVGLLFIQVKAVVDIQVWVFFFLLRLVVFILLAFVPIKPVVLF